MWSIYAMEYYSTIKRNEVLIHATTWMNLVATKDHILYDSIYRKCPE